jgi:hypothetical protein
MKPIKIVQTLAPIGSSTPQSGVTVYDFGRTTAGWERIFTRGTRGTTITCPFKTAESQICWLTQGHNVSGIAVPRLLRIMDGLEPLRSGPPLTTTLKSKGTKIFEQKDSKAAKVLV